MGKHKKSLKKHKKAKKSKTQDNFSSSENEWVEAESVQMGMGQETKLKKRSRKQYSSTSSESSEELIKKRKSRRDRSWSSSSSESRRISKTKKSSKNRCKSSSSISSEDEVIKKRQSIKKSSEDTFSNKIDENKKQQSAHVCPKDKETTDSRRDEWMDLSTSFSSFSHMDRRKQKEQEKKLQKQSEQYNPSKCSRELNPYWKDGGDGLPKFQKPKYDSDEDNYTYRSQNTYVRSESNWRKNKSDSRYLGENYKSDSGHGENKNCNLSDLSSKKESKVLNIDVTSSDKPITEKELNLLAGKLVKAEIMGNEKLVKELKEKLETARKALEETKSQDEEVILTKTDRQGQARPLTLNSEYGESSNTKKQRKKAVDTHQDKQRVRYFPDDDKYSLKQMFEDEKFNTTHDQDSEFMKIASNIRKNDDLDDFFTDNVRRKKSDSKIDEANRSKAINEHKSLTESLNDCSKCIQSNSMQKHLIISMGEYVYLSVPPHEPLTEGHCLIVPIRHVSSATQLDENEWSEILDFRRALVRLAQSKDEDPVFFEIATGFHKYPHMVLECVPLPKEEGDMAPIYFKKAIDESETEWAQNKKLVSLKGRDVRRAIPKALPYFSVSFGMEEGFAHVIEDEKLFPRNFAQEIIGGMLDLHHSKWRKPGRQSFSDQSKRVLEFSSVWKNFDCTVKT